MSIDLQSVKQRIAELQAMPVGKRFLKQTLPTIFSLSDCKDALLLGYSFQTIEDPDALVSIVSESSLDSQELFASYWGIAFPDQVVTTGGLKFNAALAEFWI